MSGKHDRYCHEQLASTGFVILGAGMPHEIRPDLWAVSTNEGGDSGEFMPRAERFMIERRATLFFVVDLVGVDGPVKVAAKSAARLAERIHELTGRVVLNLRAVQSLYDSPPEPARVVTPEASIPDYPCELRSRMLEEAGIKETRYRRG